MMALLFDILVQISQLLNHEVECSLEYMEDLSRRLELVNIMKSLNSELFHPSSPLFLLFGSTSDLNNYWSEHIRNSCSLESCPNLDEMERKLFPTAYFKNCSCNEE